MCHTIIIDHADKIEVTNLCGSEDFLKMNETQFKGRYGISKTFVKSDTFNIDELIKNAKTVKNGNPFYMLKSDGCWYDYHRNHNIFVKRR